MVTSGFQEDLIAQAWAAVSADGPATRPATPARVTLTGTAGHLASAFPVEEVAVASVGVALLAAAALSGQRGRRLRTVHLDRAHVADAVRSERYFRVAGHPAGASFAPLSRFWPAADGWVRTHANYPWHRTALVRHVGDPGRHRCRRRRRSPSSPPKRSNNEYSPPAGSRPRSARWTRGAPTPRDGPLPPSR